MISGLLFISWRIFEIITLIPILGMLAYFVHGYVDSNQLTPNFILVLFITSVLATAWAIATLIQYYRARHHGLFVALVDLAFVGALIAGVYFLRGIAGTSCTNFTAGGIYVNLGPFGYYGRQSNSPWSFDINKTCAMLKACFALGIINIIAFFITFVSFTSTLSLSYHANPNCSYSPSSSLTTTAMTETTLSSSANTTTPPATAADALAAATTAVAETTATTGPAVAGGRSTGVAAGGNIMYRRTLDRA